MGLLFLFCGGDSLDIVEFCERTGMKLYPYQKELLKAFEKIPEDSVIVFGRYRPYILQKNKEMIQNGKNTTN